MSFSLQKNKNWNGTGFFIKGSSLELSPLCFANQVVMLGSGKYRVKIIGNSISGNGNFNFSILKNMEEIFLKTISFSGKINTEISFDINISTSDQFTLKIWRGKESIGRVSISLINIVKEIEKIEQKTKILINQFSENEKTFVIIDFDKEQSFFNLFTNLKNHKNLFFLIKSEQNFIEKEKNLNFRLFFNWEDLFDFISLYKSYNILFMSNNIKKELFSKYNVKENSLCEIKDNNPSFKNISGILF